MSWIAVGVTVVSVISQVSAAGQAKKAAGQEAALNEQNAQAARELGAKKRQVAEFEAGVLETQAGQQIAASQRDMLDVQRAARLATSRTVALSAASGGGATSPSVITLVGNLAKEGSYNAARALYSGEEKARLLNLQAFERRQQGAIEEEAADYQAKSYDLQATVAEQRGKAAQTAAFGNIIGSIGGLYGKYGGGGPSGGVGMVSESVPGQFSTVNPQYG